MKGLIPYVIAGVAIATSIALSQQPTTPDPTPAPAQPNNTDSLCRLTITVAVTDPEDLKVSQGDLVEAGQLIAEHLRWASPTHPRTPTPRSPTAAAHPHPAKAPDIHHHPTPSPRSRPSNGRAALPQLFRRGSGY